MNEPGLASSSRGITATQVTCAFSNVIRQKCVVYLVIFGTCHTSCRCWLCISFSAIFHTQKKTQLTRPIDTTKFSPLP